MSIFIPFTGMRFTLYGSEYEVTYTANERVRYAAHQGGRPYIISTQKLQELVECKKAIILNKDASIEFTQNTIYSIERKHKYVHAATNNLEHPNSKKLLPAIIKEVAKTIDDQSPPSFSTVTKWIRSYIQNGRASLPPKSRPGNKTFRYPPEVEALISEAIENEFLLSERRSCLDVLAYIVGKLHERNLATSEGSTLTIPTLRTIQRRVNNLDPYSVARARKGTAYADKMARSAGSCIASYAPLSDVEIDTHFLDILLIDPDTADVLGRPYLTCILDRHTRVIVGTYICMYPPSAVTALAALTDMISRPSRGLPGGIPSKITPDNGVEFKNTSFLHVCRQLSITITPAPIREPNAKAMVESFFRTLTHGVIQKIPGTTFSSPTERGDYSSCKRAALSIEQLTEITNEWINQIYHKSIHSRTGRAPILVWQDKTKLTPPNFVTETEAQAIARRPVVRSIQHGQLQIDYIHYYSHALATLSAQGIRHVTALVNDLDLDSVLVINPLNENHLITANSNNPEYTEGLNCYMHVECKKLRNEMTASDLKRLGQLSHILARWQLLEKIQTESTKAKRWIKKIKNGKTLNNTKSTTSDIAQQTQNFTQDSPENKKIKIEKETQKTQQYNSVTPYKTIIMDSE